MATSAARKVPLQRTRPARPSTSPSTSPSKPFLRFYHSVPLRKKTLAVLGALEKAQDPSAHRAALADLVVDLTSSGMDYYFMGSLKTAKAGFIIQQSASLGLAGAMQVMGSVLRSIIGSMEASQVLSVSRSIRQLML